MHGVDWRPIERLADWSDVFEEAQEARPSTRVSHPKEMQTYQLEEALAGSNI